MLHRLRPAVACVALMAAALLGCGGDDPGAGASAPEDALTVYLSAPRRGDSAEQARAVTAGARLALREAGGEAGGARVRLITLDSSNPDDDPIAGGGWDPAAVARNAQRAASDPTAIAYIGELDFGGSAVSVPITNESGVLQISPTDGLTSLTRPLPGTGGAGPERYYPSGERSFLRLVPTDFLQASALVQWARLSGVRRLALLHDGSLFGRELASHAELVASCEGLAVARPERIEADVSRYGQVAARVAEERPDSVLYAGAAGGIASPLARALARELPSLRLFGAGGVANQPSTRAAGPGSLVSTDDRPILVTRSALPARFYPREARRELTSLAATAGRSRATDALYGYEAMSLVLDAADPADGPLEPGARSRALVRERALAPGRRRSLLGRYGIDRFGDVSASRFAGYRRQGGALRFEGLQSPAYVLAPVAPDAEAPAPGCEGILRTAPAND